MKSSMAIDQYGQCYHDLGLHPKASLLKRLGKKHAERMYEDNLSGVIFHIGWIIGGLWLRIFWVRPMMNKP